MAFTHKKIDVTFSLASGTFDNGSSTLQLSGLRVHAVINAPGGDTMNNMYAQVYGLSLSQMNMLATLGMKIQAFGPNEVTITAGDDLSGMFATYTGNISNAWSDM